MTDSGLPLPFYLCIVALWAFGLQAWKARHQAWGIPMLAVLSTVGSWYVGDVLYNDYSQYVLVLGPENLAYAWWEVLLFILTLGYLVPVMHGRINWKFAKGGSRILGMIRLRENDTEAFQAQISRVTTLLVLPWSALMGFALLRTDFDFAGLFFPFFGQKSEPWGRDRIGTGIDALYSLAGYIQVMLTAFFGLGLALSKRTNMVLLTGGLYFLSAPFILFDRTRNTMLAILLPGFMAFVVLRMRAGVLVRVAVVALAFFALNGWFRFVLDNRNFGSIAEAVRTGGVQDSAQKNQKHLGLNMFEELGYINFFIVNGTYRVNWGGRYFAEIVNPIPRVIWKGKPTIGVDYAIARGMAYGESGDKSGGIAASVATGMIGQGVVNFGRILGPMAAAFIMAVWVAVLARQDMMGNVGRLLTYSIGLVLTFNMGRDVTLLVLYPFVFGVLLCRYLERRTRIPELHSQPIPLPNVR